MSLFFYTFRWSYTLSLLCSKALSGMNPQSIWEDALSSCNAPNIVQAYREYLLFFNCLPSISSTCSSQIHTYMQYTSLIIMHTPLYTGHKTTLCIKGRWVNFRRREQIQTQSVLNLIITSSVLVVKRRVRKKYVFSSRVCKGACDLILFI